jgi:hypothetical protein
MRSDTEWREWLGLYTKERMMVATGPKLALFIYSLQKISLHFSKLISRVENYSQANSASAYKSKLAQLPFHHSLPSTRAANNFSQKYQHATKARRRKGWREEGRVKGQEHCQGGEEASPQEEGVLRRVHLQGPQAGPPRHRRLLKGHVHHELFRQ